MEATTLLDPVLSDCLYMVDNSLPVSSRLLAWERSEMRLTRTGHKTLLLNGWQSYGRAAVRHVDIACQRIRSERAVAAVLPCALRRPYDESVTHKKTYGILETAGFPVSTLHRVVISSLGVLPEEVWNLPAVRAYDAGVPDVYRILRLARRFFRSQRYELVLDCLQFEPYSDVLRIIEREGLIGRLRRVRIPGRRPFFIRN